MGEFRAFLEGLGLKPRRITPDGRIYRCPTADKPRKRNGAYMLAPDGLMGWGQDHAKHESPVIWREEREENLPSPEELVALRKRVADAARERAKKQRKAAREAWEYYAASERLGDPHPYLQRKGLSHDGCDLVRVDADGWLVVPSWDGRRLATVQRISPEGKKLFWSGASVSGSVYRAERRRAEVTIYCEGLATGLALYQAVPHSRVIVCWSTANLRAVPEAARGMVVVAADNDHGTADRTGSNPGIDAGEEAAAELGCGVAYPQGIQGTDWADYRVEAFDQGLAHLGKWETEAGLQRRVDARIRREIMRHATYVVD